MLKRTKDFRRWYILLPLMLLIVIFSTVLTFSYFTGKSKGGTDNLTIATLNTLISLNNEPASVNSVSFPIAGIEVGSAVVENLSIRTANGSVDGFVRVKVEFKGSVTNNISQAVATALNELQGEYGYDTYTAGVGYSWVYLDGYYYLCNNGELVSVQDDDDGFVLFNDNANHETIYLPDITTYNIPGATYGDVTLNIYVQAIQSEHTYVSTPAQMRDLIDDNGIFVEDEFAQVYLIQFNTMGGKKIPSQIITPDTQNITLPYVAGEIAEWYRGFDGTTYTGYTASSGSTIPRGNIDSNFTLYAKYQDNRIAVMFDKDSKVTGTLPSVQYISCDVSGTQSVTVGTKLSKLGYDYNSWTVDYDTLVELNPDKSSEWINSHLRFALDGTTIQVPKDIVPSGMAITLQPDWQAITYTATFDCNGGDLLDADKALERTVGVKVYECVDSEDKIYEYEYNIEMEFVFPSAVTLGKVFQGWVISTAVSAGKWRVSDCYISGLLGAGYLQDVTFVAQWGELSFNHPQISNNTLTTAYGIGKTITIDVVNSTSRIPTYSVLKNQAGEPVTSDVVSVALGTASSITLNILKVGSAIVQAEVRRAGVLSIARFELIVTPRAIDADGIVISDIPDKQYCGSAITPTIVVYDGSTMLELNTDYTVTYSNNTNIGTAIITITGMGNYDDLTTKQGGFTITPRPVSIRANPQTITYGQTLSQSANDVVVNGLLEGHSLVAITLTPSDNNVPGGTIMVSGAVIHDSQETNVTSNYELIYDNTSIVTINKAEAFAVLGQASGTVEYGTPSTTFTILSSSGAVTVGDNNPTAVATLSGGIVTISNLETLNAGTSIVVTLSIAESRNYNSGVISYTLEIEKYHTTITSLNITGLCMVEHTITAEVTKPGNGTIHYQWLIGSTADGEFENITGATNASYSIGSRTMIGKFFRIAITVDETQNYLGITTPVTATSTACLDNRYTVIFDKQGGNGGTTSVVATYEYVMPTGVDITAPIRPGYRFSGYYEDSECEGTQYYTATMTSDVTFMNIGNMQLYAKWTPVTYSITFVTGGGIGTIPNMTGIKYDREYQLTENVFTKVHYTFAGWCVTNNLDATTAMYGTTSSTVTNPVDAVTVIGDMNYIKNLTTVDGAVVTLTAQWDADTYAITLDRNTGHLDGTTTIYEKYETGVYLDSTRLYEMTDSQNAITAPAKTYTVQFIYNGATGNNSQASITSTAVFSGFYTGIDSGSMMIDDDGFITSAFAYDYFGANGTLYAHWGAGNTITLPTPTKTSYAFKGWYTDAELTNKAGNGGAGYSPPGDITLYAKWDETFITFESTNSFTLDSLIGKSWNSAHWTSKKLNYQGNGYIEWSTDLSTWHEWDGFTQLSSTTTGTTKVLYLRGLNNAVITGYNVKSQFHGSATELNIGWYLESSGHKGIVCNGNIENLLDYSVVAVDGHPTMDTLTYRGLFAQCKDLIKGPDLPAMTLTNECYGAMFINTGLMTLPALPATTLASNCYGYMFEGCKNVKISTTETSLCSTEYRIPAGDGVQLTAEAPNNAGTEMFRNTATSLANNGTVRIPVAGLTYYISSIHAIELNNLDAAVTGTTYIYEDNESGNHFANLVAEQLMGLSSNPIVVPSRSFTITYEYNGATSGNSIASTPYNWIFNGYYYNSTQMITASGYATSDLLNGRYPENTVFDASWSYPVGPITLPSPQKTGYIFGGWYTNSTLTRFAGNAGASYTPTSSSTLYAKWTPITYTVHFNLNDNGLGGIGSMTDQAFTYDEEQTLNINNYRLAHWRFEYWATNADGTGEQYYDEEEVSNLSSVDGDVVQLYVYWIWVEFYTITLNGNDATTQGTATIVEVADDYQLCLDDVDWEAMTKVANPIATLPTKSTTITYEYNGATTKNGANS